MTSAYVAGIADGAAAAIQAVSEDIDSVQNILSMPPGSGTVPIVLEIAGFWRVEADAVVNVFRFGWDQPVTAGFAGWLD